MVEVSLVILPNCYLITLQFYRKRKPLTVLCGSQRERLLERQAK